MKKYQLVTPDLTHEEFSLFQDFIEKSSAIFLDESKQDTMRTALLARTTALNLGSYSEYYTFLKYNPRGEEEFKELLNLLTICETYFFRDNKHYELLKTTILPQLIKEKEASGDKGIRIWSAGCSTGEEPYSMAITFLEAMGELLEEGWLVEIFASDVSTKALAHAKKGVYSKWAMRATSKRMTSQYFDEEENKYYLKDYIKKMVDFGYFNLIKEPYPLSKMGNYWDIIFCKNVTIYFKPESTKRVIQNFYRSLRANGYLFIGSSESLYHIDSHFTLVELNKCFLYQKGIKAGRTRIKVEKIELPAKMITAATPEGQAAIPPPAAESKPVIERRPSREEIERLYSRAESYFQREQFDQALFELMKIIEKTDRHPSTHLMIADIYANVGRYADAEAECRHALNLDSLLAPAHYLLGIILQKKGEIEESVEEFKKTIFLEPYSPLAHLNLGNIYYDRAEHNKAIKEYQSAIKLLQENGKKDDLGAGLSKKVLVQTCQRNIERATRASIASR